MLKDRKCEFVLARGTCHSKIVIFERDGKFMCEIHAKEYDAIHRKDKKD